MTDEELWKIIRKNDVEVNKEYIQEQMDKVAKFIAEYIEKQTDRVNDKQ